MTRTGSPRWAHALSLVAAFVALFATSATAQTVDAKPDAKKEVLEKVSDILTHRAFIPGVDFAKLSEYLEAEKPKLEGAKSDDDFARAMNEAFAKFGASHIMLATPRATEIRQKQKTVGIGITSQITPEGVVIVRVVPKAPSDEAGLVPGDTIVEVDGKKVEGIKGIPGPEGTQVKIKVKHADGKLQEYTLTRKTFSTVRKEVLNVIGRDTAKLTVYTFDLTYDRANVEQLMTEAAKYPKLLLDLRDNGGGAVMNLQHLLGLLVPAERTVGTFVNRRMVDAYTEKVKPSEIKINEIADWSKQDSKYDLLQIKPFANRKVSVYKGTVAVLINGMSGSASEICAAALRDTIGARVVGTKSAGAVLVSTIVNASNGFSLQYPLMDYVTVTGRRLEGNGVVPDLEVTESRVRLPNQPDLTAEKAANLLASVQRA